ncbi:hypothetical protein EYF80_057266 [Liparis tanakae]|uniref:Neuromedin U C-terminal domain-containing protein n=1 Tax=Liparis tanakae TaxID=230148 RepID=A0A4Z2EW32_9TELE|nr:hypothetical protein EYF80_057266 [Liparis tanakae]
MRTFQTRSQAARRGAPRGSLSPLGAAGVALAALLLLAVPRGCSGAPAKLPRAPTDPQQLLSRIDAVCSSYYFADLKFWELKGQENSKRADLQGPGGIQSRGYFLYRPRNGRRSLEYE